MRKPIVLGILLVIMSLFGQRFAVAALMGSAGQPNLYELSDEDVQIVYSTTSFTGEPRLSYRDALLSLDFSGNEIRVLATEIGQQVTVTLEQVPDLKTITLTLLIPDINLINGPTKFKTAAVTTTHRTSIGGPALVTGQIQSYRTRYFTGVASQVAFLLQGLSTIVGEVTLSPACPSPQRPGQDCTRPYAGAAVQLFDAYNSLVGSTTTDAAGVFTLSVFPADYTVHIDTGGRLTSCPDIPVNATAAGGASVLVSCHTGIR